MSENMKSEKSAKKNYLISLDSQLKEWSKTEIKNFSGFVENTLREFSASVANNSKR